MYHNRTDGDTLRVGGSSEAGGVATSSNMRNAWDPCRHHEDCSSWSCGLAMVALASSIANPLFLLDLRQESCLGLIDPAPPSPSSTAAHAVHEPRSTDHGAP